MYPVKSGLDNDVTKRGGRYQSDFIWNTNWKDKVGRETFHKFNNISLPHFSYIELHVTNWKDKVEQMRRMQQPLHGSLSCDSTLPLPAAPHTAPPFLRMQLDYEETPAAVLPQALLKHLSPLPPRVHAVGL